MDWKREDDPHYEETWVLRFTFMDHGPGFPFVVLSELKIYAPDDFDPLDGKNVDRFAYSVLQEIVLAVDEEPLAGLIEDNTPKFVVFQFELDAGRQYTAFYVYRKIGWTPAWTRSFIWTIIRGAF
jgi:hypothetical protein